MSYTVRPFQAEDEKYIIELYNKEFHQNRTVDQWQWEFKFSPGGDPVHYVLCDDQKPIGQMVALPLEMRRSEKCISTARGQALFIDRQYRFVAAKEGLASKLINAVLCDVYKKGIKAVWGFPLPHAERTFIQAGFKKFPVTAWKRILTYKPIVEKISKKIPQNLSTNLLNIAGKLILRKVSLPDNCTIESNVTIERITSLWMSLCKDVPFSIDRNEKFLDWRFIKNPFYRNDFNIVKYKNNPIGYFISGVRSFDIVKKGYLIDLCFDHSSSENGNRLLQCASYYMQSKMVDEIVVWQWGSKSEVTNILEKSLFKYKVDGGSLVCHTKESSTDIPPADQWFVTMAGMEGISF